MAAPTRKATFNRKAFNALIFNDAKADLPERGYPRGVGRGVLRGAA